MVSDVQPVTFDYSDSASQEEGVDFRSLQDLAQGNAYRLRRIVGKFHAAANINNNAETVIPTVDLAAGFMVCRTDDDGNILVEQAGISGDVTRGPLAQDGAEDPWIWRRRWLLSTVPSGYVFNDPNVANIAGDLFAYNTALGFQGQFPQTTAGYGSVQDGPHIDQKTARVISSNERLFFWVQGRLSNPSDNTNTADINWQLDMRLLASLRQNVGNRRNASR